MYVADIVAINSASEIAMLVEVKVKLGTTETWAAQMRRNLFAHGSRVKAKYFLLAHPDHFYLWQESAVAQTLSSPSHCIDPTELLAPYFERAHLSLETIGHVSFGMIIAWWIENLFEGRDRPANADAHDAWITESGLWNELAGGRLEYEVRV